MQKGYKRTNQKEEDTEKPELGEGDHHIEGEYEEGNDPAHSSEGNWDEEDLDEGEVDEGEVYGELSASGS